MSKSTENVSDSTENMSKSTVRARNGMPIMSKSMAYHFYYIRVKCKYKNRNWNVSKSTALQVGKCPKPVNYEKKYGLYIKTG